MALCPVLTCCQGVAPTLVYPVPPPEKYWILSKIIHSIRDYYPLWQVGMRRAHMSDYLTATSFAACLPDNCILVSVVYLFGTATSPLSAAQSACHRPGGDPRGCRDRGSRWNIRGRL